MSLLFRLLALHAFFDRETSCAQAYITLFHCGRAAIDAILRESAPGEESKEEPRVLDVPALLKLE
jgi:hypothetical protein